MGGLFITVEGPEGAGKTTVMNVVNELLIAAGYETVTTREPGGIKISEKIREIILDKDHKEMDSLTEALLYAAARRQHLIEKVRPALENGKIVLCDRFIDSSIAYQGYARGIGMDEVSQINELAVEGYMPDLTIFFDIQPELGLARIAANGSREVNRLDLEGLEFHHKVYKGYEIQANKYPERIVRVDATLSIETLAEQIKDMIVSKFKEANA